MIGQLILAVIAITLTLLMSLIALRISRKGEQRKKMKKREYYYY